MCGASTDVRACLLRDSACAVWCFQHWKPISGCAVVIQIAEGAILGAPKGAHCEYAVLTAI